jgi:hypothetical protein
MKDELYATHIPILTKLVDMSDGPILELGMGFSTLILDMMCKLTRRPIVSYENHREWYERYLEFASDYHKILFTDNWDSIDIDSTHWSIALIDHKPALRRRIDAVRLKDNCDYVILHDSEPEINRFYAYTRIYQYFKYRYDYTKCLPNTTVLSNFKELKFLT